MMWLVVKTDRLDTLETVKVIILFPSIKKVQVMPYISYLSPSFFLKKNCGLSDVGKYVGQRKMIAVVSKMPMRFAFSMFYFCIVFQIEVLGLMPSWKVKNFHMILRRV